MPIDGLVLRTPWGGEQIYTRTRDGCKFWADDLRAAAMEAEERGFCVADVWALNAETGESLLERFHARLEIQGPIAAVRDYATARDIVAGMFAG